MNCTLYGVASFTPTPSANASLVIFNCNRAASFNMEKVHSYGYEMNGTKGWVIAMVQGADNPTKAGSTMVDSMRSPDFKAFWMDFFSHTASMSFAPSAVKALTTLSPETKTRLRGSRKEPGS